MKFKEWKKRIKANRKGIILSLFLLLISLVFLYLSGRYVDNTSSIAVPDLLLDFLPPIDLSFLFVYGFLLVLAVFIFYPLFYEPEKFSYFIGSLGIFTLIRSGFIILTHLKVPLEAVTITTPIAFLTNTNDLFFSGHAGLPFLGFLLFKNKKIKYFMLVSSIILAITVLLMHVHYSIDVVSAYFISYGVYKISQKIFE